MGRWWRSRRRRGSRSRGLRPSFGGRPRPAPAAPFVGLAPGTAAVGAPAAAPPSETRAAAPQAACRCAPDGELRGPRRPAGPPGPRGPQRPERAVGDPVFWGISAMAMLDRGLPPSAMRRSTQGAWRGISVGWFEVGGIRGLRGAPWLCLLGAASNTQARPPATPRPRDATAPIPKSRAAHAAAERAVRPTAPSPATRLIPQIPHKDGARRPVRRRDLGEGLSSPGNAEVRLPP
jgi:hypothetical protein